MPDCSIFTRCSAPICPLCLNGGEIWFTDEPICSKHNITKTYPWVKTQRKLAKKHQGSHDAGFFTVEILNKTARVSRSSTGRDPDRPEKPSKIERKSVRSGGSGGTMTPDRIKTLRGYLAAARLRKKRVLEEK